MSTAVLPFLWEEGKTASYVRQTETTCQQPGSRKPVPKSSVPKQLSYCFSRKSFLFLKSDLSTREVREFGKAEECAEYGPCPEKQKQLCSEKCEGKTIS